MTKTILEARGLTKAFGGMTALDGLSMHLNEGEILGLIGPNGSGKSTLVNLMSGVLSPTAGRVFMHKEEITGEAAHQIARRGVSRTFQMIRLFDSLTVEDNIALALQQKEGPGYISSFFRSSAARHQRSDARARTREMLRLFDLEEKAESLAADLSIGQRRMVELARGLATEPRVFILDEPAAGLAPQNVDRLIEMIRRMRDDFGVTILLVEHVMRVVQSVCDRVVVLDYGQKIADGPPEEVIKEPQVIEAYIGLGRKANA